MQNKFAEWLPHLSGEIVSEARGNYLDAYVVALEGWRRGLALRWHIKESEKFPDMETWFVDKPGQLFSLSSADKTHYFFRTRGDRVPNDAVNIGRDKGKTKKRLQSNYVQMPDGEEFEETTSNEDIIRYTSQIGFPVVLKPVNSSFGKGVISNIRGTEEMEKALDYVRRKLNFPEVMIEKYIPGKEYRIYVVDGEVVGAMNRIPANVTGDGKSSIKTLIEQKNVERSLNPRLISCPILINEEVEDYISRQGFSLESILDAGRNVLLTDKTNISIGGDPVDVLDIIPPDIKETAVRALQAVPGLEHGAVDLIVHSETSHPYVIELNPTANLGGLLYPIQGKARDIPKAIIDHYFPETRNEDGKTSRIYFDYMEVLKPLQDKTADNTKVTSFEYNDLYAKKFLMKGEVENFALQKWIRGKARIWHFNGSTKILDKGTLEIIIAGKDKTDVDDFGDILEEKRSEYGIMEIINEDYDGTVKVGFEIQGERKELLNNHGELQSQLIASEKELKFLEKKHLDMLNSRAWKMTLPIRNITGSLKNIYNRFSDKKR